MFPTQSKAHRSARLWLLPAFALVMLLVAYAVFAYSSAEAQTLPGDYCIEGIVINWEEKPLAGWTITLTNDISPTQVLTAVSAPEPDDDEDDPDFEKGEFGWDEDDGIIQAPGNYTATIESREGWEGVTPTTITFPINVGEDDCVRIRFKMRRIVPVEVIKFDANHVGLEEWLIKVQPGKGNLFASPDEEETDVNGAAYFTLTPGIWVFSEFPPKDDRGDYMPVVPPNGQQVLEIDDDLPVTATLQVIFKNELVVGCIAVQKIGVIPEENGTGELVTPVDGVYTGNYGVPGWSFKLLRKDGTIARQGVTDATGYLEFENLPLGPYTLVEENRAGWDEITERELDIVVDGCEDPAEVFTFENEQDESGFCIEGYKIDANGGYGLAGWEFSADPEADGGFEPDDATTDGTGYFRFEFPRDDYRIPGATYEICEEEQDGWLPHTDTCQTVTLPEWPMGDCIELKDFVNQQVGHSESERDHDKGGMWMGGNDMGGKPMACSTYHVVKGGEGLYDIGRMYNKSPQQMLNANPDVKDSKHQWVYVGQKICIP